MIRNRECLVGEKVDECIGDYNGPTVLTLSEPEVWPEPVDGEELLALLTTEICRQLGLTEREAGLVALWICHAHNPAASATNPPLVFFSHTPQYGTEALLLVRQLVPRPLDIVSVPPGDRLRVVDERKPTLLIDSLTCMHLRKGSTLRVLVECSFDRGASIGRCSPHEPVNIDVAVPLVIATTGELPPKVRSRGIIVPLRRKSRKLSMRSGGHPALLQELNRKLARWSQDNANALASADTELPSGALGRVDKWLPFLGIADRVGGPWPKIARQLMVASSGDEEWAV